ncbi:12864_t:CDS:1, partial [Acaulospora colombiana]
DVMNGGALEMYGVVTLVSIDIYKETPPYQRFPFQKPFNGVTLLSPAIYHRPVEHTPQPWSMVNEFLSLEVERARPIITGRNYPVDSSQS